MAPAYATIDPATLGLAPSKSTSPPPPPSTSARPPPPPASTSAPPPPPPASTSKPPSHRQASSTPAPSRLASTSIPPPPEESTQSATTSTPRSTDTSRPVTSFPFLPLTTVFTPPAPECTRLTSVEGPPDYLRFATDRTCFPPGYTSGPGGFFFSPGIACPSGYRTACQDSRGIESVTTVTCCPTLENMPDMRCVGGSETSDTMDWFQCRATVPASGMTLSLVGSNTETYTALQTVISPEVIYAYGIRMVYEATDLTTASPTASATSSITISATSPPSSGSKPAASSGLSIGATVAICVAITLAVLAVSVAAFLLWQRKRRQRQSRAAAAAWEKSHELPAKPHERSLPNSPHEMTSDEVMAEMPGTRNTVELPARE